ncbi:hypothetical protein FKR81_36975 [Lentzea tibetensis]|uniref:Uncharacterized protein n=1 Tax=Lentzea tibetensis TaxID=2591470 RepID=A0A563EI50_9PSEU|nr:hypothetical protein [Lentzea tibetensis]TWP46127.1 hypothetical protein FKR81_36975 [Lentzea tibetensis]
MNEQDLKRAFQDVMVASSPPPSMDPSQALGVAHKARSRRRSTWAGALVAVVVVGVGVGAALIVPDGSAPSPSLQMGNSNSAPPSVTPTSGPPTTRQSGDPWPDGQTDRTATSGPHADKAVVLMNDLGSSLPPGFTAPDLKHPDGRPIRRPQAQYAANVGEQDYWEYMATIPVKKDAGVGVLLVQSRTPDGKPAGDLCELAQTFWGMPGECSVLDAGGKKVGVVTKNTSGRDDFDQWAAYRHEDGTVIFLAQSVKVGEGGYAPLAQPVFTPQQLAEQATSAKFKVS